MADVHHRVAALSQQRRLLLDRLADARAPHETSEWSLPVRSELAMFYDGVSERLNATQAGQWSLFLNYGYLDGADDRSVVELPERTVDRTSVKLVLELVGDAPVHGSRILDVGCGRGGTVAALLRYFDPRAVTGLDISATAVKFCTAQREVRATFVVGDSADIPCAEATFDIVTNVESSHCYPDVSRFYAEVHRVLVPGGLFLYTDLLPTSTLSVRREALRRLGFRTELARDITANVLGSCDLVSARRAAAFAGDSDDLSDFLAMPGSSPYEAMRSGSKRYVLWHLRAGG